MRIENVGSGFPVKPGMTLCVMGYFNRGDEFVVEFIGVDNAVYQFTTVLMEKRKDGIPLLVLSTPDPMDFKRVQRREYVRVPDSLKVSLATNEGVLISTALNISAGGMAVKLRDKFGIEIGNQVACEFFLYGSLQRIGCSVKRIWGDREFTFKDPDGYLISFYSKIK